MIDVAGVFTGKRDCDGAGLAALGGVRAGLAALCGRVVRGEHAESAVVRGWDAG